MSPASTSAILYWAEALYQRLHGFDHDGRPGQPGPPAIDGATRIAAAEVLRIIAGNIREAKAAREVKTLSLGLAERGAGELIRGWPDDVEPPRPGLPTGPVDPHPYYPPKKLEWRQSVFEGVAPGAVDQLLLGVARRLADAASAPVAAPKGGTRGG